ncbi:MAG: hypothetical protein MUC65_05040 [Pontiellaceae bacterium]|jgi:hypothetical protein|nr:hypothetical protein [Pontiellaceae bacterium]
MTSARQKPIRSSSVLATWTITALLAATIYFPLFFKEKSATVKDLQKNELKAYEHIRRLINAQSLYIQRDYDGNGSLEYALFIPHLWRSIGKNNEKIKVNLLPRKTAFAIGEARTVNGYYFVQKFTKTDPQNPENTVDIDPSIEWGALMIPAEPGDGFLAFFTDQSGLIYVNHSDSRLEIPDDPGTDAQWIPLKDIEHLKSIQRQVRDLYSLN